MGQNTLTLDALRNQTEIPALIVDQQGLIIFVNAHFEQVFGWQPGEIIGEFVGRIIPKRMHDAHNLGFSRFITTGQPTILGKLLTLTAVNKAGVEFAAEHHMIAEQNEGQWLFGATIKPVDPDDL